MAFKIQPRTPLFYLTSFVVLGGTFYALDKYLSGGYYNYILHHKMKKLEQQEAAEDLARDRIKKRELERQKQQQQQQQNQ